MVKTTSLLVVYNHWTGLVDWTGVLLLNSDYQFAITVWTNHVSSFPHHFLSPRLPESWYRDHPVEVCCFKVKVFQYCKQSIFEMVKDVCDNIHQIELVVIHSKYSSIPVNILRERKCALDKLANNTCQKFWHVMRLSVSTKNSTPTWP